MSENHLLDEAGLPMLAEAAAASAVDDSRQVSNGGGCVSDMDGRALAAAYEIALMWGQDRSQFVAKIQRAVRNAMDWAMESDSAAHRKNS